MGMRLASVGVSPAVVSVTMVSPWGERVAATYKGMRDGT